MRGLEVLHNEFEDSMATGQPKRANAIVARAGKPLRSGNAKEPSCLFADPPLAHVGLTEHEAEGQRTAVRVARLPISAVLRTPHDR